MLYYITPLVYNFKCDWYDNWDRRLAVYELHKEWYLIQNSPFDQKYAVKLT